MLTTICVRRRVMIGRPAKIESGIRNSISSKPPGIGALKRYRPATSTKVIAIIRKIVVPTIAIRTASNGPSGQTSSASGPNPSSDIGWKPL